MTRRSCPPLRRGSPVPESGALSVSLPATGTASRTGAGTSELPYESFKLSELTGPDLFAATAAGDAIRGGGETDETAVSECGLAGGVEAASTLRVKEGGIGGTGGGGSGVIVGNLGDAAD